MLERCDQYFSSFKCHCFCFILHDIVALSSLQEKPTVKGPNQTKHYSLVCCYADFYGFNDIMISDHPLIAAPDCAQSKNSTHVWLLFFLVVFFFYESSSFKSKNATLECFPFAQKIKR